MELVKEVASVLVEVLAAAVAPVGVLVVEVVLVEV